MAADATVSVIASRSCRTVRHRPVSRREREAVLPPRNHGVFGCRQGRQVEEILADREIVRRDDPAGSGDLRYGCVRPVEVEGVVRREKGSVWVGAKQYVRVKRDQVGS